MMDGGYAPGGLSLEEMIDGDMKSGSQFDDILGNTSGFSNMDSLEMLDNLGELNFPLGDTAGLEDWSLDSVAPIALTNGAGLNGLHGHNGAGGPAPSLYGNGYGEDGTPGMLVNPNNVMPVTAPASVAPTTAPLTQTTANGAISAQQQQRLTVSSTQSFSPQQLSPAFSLQPHPQQQLQQLQQQQALPQQPIGAPPLYGATIVPTVKGGTSAIGIVSRGQAKNVTVLTSGSPGMQNMPVTLPSLSNANRKKNPNVLGAKAATEKENGFPKPAYSYSCLIALALKNSRHGSMSVSEIYKFMCEHFPYFKTAPSGWKNSVRHNLSLNKCFEKIEKPATNGTNQRKGCLWAMNPAKVNKMDEEVLKWSRKDPQAIKKGMAFPHTLEALERGQMVKDYNANSTNAGSSASTGAESEDDEDPRTPTSVSSQGSQGYDSAGSDFVDIEGYQQIPDASLNEVNIQASGGIYEDLGEDRLQFGVAHSTASISTSAPVNGVVTIASNPTGGMNGGGGNTFYSTIHGNYSIQPTAANGASSVPSKTFNTVVLQKQHGQKVFSI